jgi:hypothetical protein
MNRLQEVERKHERLRDLLKRRDAGSLWLRRTRNLAWITAGAEVAIVADSESAPLQRADHPGEARDHHR